MQAVQFGMATDTGIIRQVNQDAVLVWQHPASPAAGVFGVIDGMGRAEDGTNPGALTAAMLSAALEAAPHPAPLRDLLMNTLGDINHALNQQSYIGAHVTLALVDNYEVLLLHVGETRAYCINADEMQLLTRDQNRITEMLRMGAISREDAQQAYIDMTMNRALGIAADTPNIDTESLSFEPGECLLLCTDGLSRHCNAWLQTSPCWMADVVRSRPPQAACDSLIERVNQLGGFDNASAVVVAF